MHPEQGSWSTAAAPLTCKTLSANPCGDVATMQSTPSLAYIPSTASGVVTTGVPYFMAWLTLPLTPAPLSSGATTTRTRKYRISSCGAGIDCQSQLTGTSTAQLRHAAHLLVAQVAVEQHSVSMRVHQLLQVGGHYVGADNVQLEISTLRLWHGR